MAIEQSELDGLQKAYKEATDTWVAAIRVEQSLAPADHSVDAWDRWEQAGFKAKEAAEIADTAKEAYREGLRQFDYDL